MARSMASDTVAVRLLTAKSTEFSLKTHDDDNDNNNNNNKSVFQCM
jgi:hypothetical protein